MIKPLSVRATLILIFAFSLQAWPQGTKPSASPSATRSTGPVNSSQETSIRKLGVALLVARVKDKRWDAAWNQRRQEFQRNFVAFLNERSSVEGVPVNRQYGITEDNDVIVSNARADGVDGVLGGEYQGQSLQIVLRSGSTGRPLLFLSVPAKDISREPIRQLAKAAVDAVVNSLPYRGFIVAVAPSGKEAKINLGKSQGLKVGDRLEILDFDGETPTFSSPTYKVGELKIAKLSTYAAIGQITSSYGPVKPYQKLSLLPDNVPEAQAAPVEEEPTSTYDSRVSQKFWASLGTEIFYINTQISGSQNNLLERQFEVPASPAIALGFGASKVNFFLMASSLSNSSNSVAFLQGTGTYQVYTVATKKMAALTSVGLYYSDYSVTPSSNPATLLVSTTTLSPVIEERLQWTTGLHARAFAAAQLFYPVFSSDSLNGSSSAAVSFGGGLEAGMGFDFSNKLGLEGGLKLHYLSSQLPNTSSISELEMNLFAHVIFLF